jgi:hypothetical protein
MASFGHPGFCFSLQTHGFLGIVRFGVTTISACFEK